SRADERPQHDRPPAVPGTPWTTTGPGRHGGAHAPVRGTPDRRMSSHTTPGEGTPPLGAGWLSMPSVIDSWNAAAYETNDFTRLNSVVIVVKILYASVTASLAFCTALIWPYTGILEIFTAVMMRSMIGFSVEIIMSNAALVFSAMSRTQEAISRAKPASLLSDDSHCPM